MQEMQETGDPSLGREDPLEKEMATCSSILAWETPWAEKPGELQTVESQRVRHNLATEHAHSEKEYLFYFLLLLLLFVCFCLFFFFFLPEKLLEKRFQTLGKKMLFKYVSLLMKKVIECFDQIPQKTHFFFAS